MKFNIVGTGRCGTTLLRRILSSYPLVYVFNETHIIPKLYEKFGSLRVDASDILHVLDSSFHITGQKIIELDSETRSILSNSSQVTVKEFFDLMGESFAKKYNKEIWADKTPDYGVHMRLIHDTWPDCKFIHVIRHGGSTALSMSKHPGYQWLVSAKEISWSLMSYNKYYSAVEIKQNPIEQYSIFWKDRLLRIRDEARKIPSSIYYELKYEDLCTDPSNTLRDLFSFLELPFIQDWVDNVIKQIDSRKGVAHLNAAYPFIGKSERELLSRLGY